MRGRHLGCIIEVALARKVKEMEPRILYKTERTLIVYFKNFLTFEAQDLLLQKLSTKVKWRQEVDDFGLQKRESFYMGDDPSCIFSYVGLELVPNDWDVDCRAIKEKINTELAPYISKQLQLEEKTCYVTACLLNYYSKGGGDIPWHWDEVRAHGIGKVVASVSLGVPRPFELKRRRTDDVNDGRSGPNAPTTSIALEPGSVLLMAGDAQEEFLHRVPLPENAPDRISLTMRSIVPGFEEELKKRGPTY